MYTKVKLQRRRRNIKITTTHQTRQRRNLNCKNKYQQAEAFSISLPCALLLRTLFKHRFGDRNLLFMNSQCVLPLNTINRIRSPSSKPQTQHQMFTIVNGQPQHARAPPYSKNISPPPIGNNGKNTFAKLETPEKTGENKNMYTRKINTQR